jgi:ABC-type Mn2+/Zn2+ transport system permease subunit
MVHVLATGLLAVILGAGASYTLDLPTGAAIVCVFGLLLGLQVTVEALLGRRHGRMAP